MAFKKSTQTAPAPDTPDQLLLDLPRRKIPNVLPHQREIMRTYATKATTAPDVALQLPTGSGKTLVALLIGEWLRRKNKERVVYLCPTNQLVHQVTEQAGEKYGLTVRSFVGSAAQYDPAGRADYQNADTIAITNYSSLFNTRPFFKNADIIIIDDAHAAENYIAALWSVTINRKEHTTLHTALCNILKPILDTTTYTRLTGKWENPADRGWVDKLPTTTLAQLTDQITEVIDTHADAHDDIKYPWSMIRDHLNTTHLYFANNEILIRPLIPPTWTHDPFNRARQRIYMSATLGAGGDLERLTGRRAITRLQVPTGWDKQGVGRRFFIFPEMSLNPTQTTELRHDLMRKAGRSIVLVPSDKLATTIANEITNTLKYPVFTASDIETSKKPFVQTKSAVAIAANRYDGIDFPGEECRLLFIQGYPRAVNLQERFLMSRMAANLLFNDRIQTRILQATGRCTRSLEDYSAVVVSGEELPDYLADPRRRQYLHPELQAEIAFGVEQSRSTTPHDFIENFQTFLQNGKEWESVNQEIVNKRNAAKQDAFPAMDELRAAVEHEVWYQEALWQGDYENALASAETVLGLLKAPDLRGYRALWHYLAGSSAWLASQNGNTTLLGKARQQFASAKGAATGISWLVKLAQTPTEKAASTSGGEALLAQLERVETILAQLGTVHDRTFAQREKTILEGLKSKEKGPFEQAHKLLGELLGYDAGKVETDGAPDPWWTCGNTCFVFEDHQGAQEDSALDVTKARQVATHPNWVLENLPLPKDAEIIPVLVTPVTKAKQGAMPHLKTVYLWPIKEFRTWAKNALAAVRALRVDFLEPGNLVWRAKAAEAFVQHHLDASGLAAALKARPAKDHLKPIP